LYGGLSRLHIKLHVSKRALIGEIGGGFSQAKLTRRSLPRYHAYYTYSGVAGLGRYLLLAIPRMHYTSGDAPSFGSESSRFHSSSCSACNALFRLENRIPQARIASAYSDQMDAASLRRVK
jgi:hypothetical protein